MASSLCKCLLRVCFSDETPDDDDDDYSREDEVETYEPLRSNRMSRLFQSTDPLYSAAQVEEPVDENDEDDADDNNCCQNDTTTSRNNNTSNTTTTTTGGSTITTTSSTAMWSDNNPHAVGLKQFWRRFTERFNLEDPGSSGAVTSSSSSSNNSNNTRQSFTGRRSSLSRVCIADESSSAAERDERIPILTQASSFDSSKEVLTIQTEQIVLPGSELQQQMAKAMACKLVEEQDDECVICMDGFDPTNPRMPTLCGCGENKTYFHLPCLYQWIEQDRNCPSCRKRLRWEEF